MAKGGAVLCVVFFDGDDDDVVNITRFRDIKSDSELYNI